MAGEVVLVTGTSSGIGKAIAVELPKHGLHVIAAMRGTTGKNASVAAELRETETAAGGRCDVVDIDVTSDASVAAGVAEAVALAGRIDVLVNCAGIMWLGVAEAFGVGQLETVMQTNLLGPFRMLKAVLPQMRAQRSGLTIAVTSIAGRLVTPGSALYSASKFALEALTEGMRYEVSSLGIECVLIEPGPFRTNLKDNAQPPEDLEAASAYGALRQAQRLVVERMGTLMAEKQATTDPNAVAAAVLDLIRLPAGQRPLRTTIGLDLGVHALNQAAAPFQRAYLAAMGLESTEQIARFEGI